MKKTPTQLQREIDQVIGGSSSRPGERLVRTDYLLIDEAGGDVVRTATPSEIKRYRASKGKALQYTNHLGNQKWGYVGRLYEDADENQYVVDMFDE